jgi:hypothetical protein
MIVPRSKKWIKTLQKSYLAPKIMKQDVGYIPDQERPRGGGEVGLLPICVGDVTRGNK